MAYLLLMVDSSQYKMRPELFLTPAGKGRFADSPAGRGSRQSGDSTHSSRVPVRALGVFV